MSKKKAADMSAWCKIRPTSEDTREKSTWKTDVRPAPKPKKPKAPPKPKPKPKPKPVAPAPPQELWAGDDCMQIPEEEEPLDTWGPEEEPYEEVMDDGSSSCCAYGESEDESPVCYQSVLEEPQGARPVEQTETAITYTGPELQLEEEFF